MSDFVNSDFVRTLPKAGPVTNTVRGAGAAVNSGRTKIDPRTAGSARPAGKAGAAQGTAYQPRQRVADVAEHIEHASGEGATQIAFFDMFFLPIAMVVGRVVGVVPGVGPYLRTALSGPFMALSRSLNCTKLSEFYRFPGNFAHEWGAFAHEVHGEKSLLSRGFKGLGGMLGENISKQVAGAEAATAESFTRQMLKDFTSAQGKETWATKRAAKLRASHMEKVAEEAQGIISSLEKPHSGIMTDISSNVRGLVGKLTGKAPAAKVPAGYEVPAELREVKAAAEALHKAASGEAAHVDYGHMIGRMEDLSRKFQEVQHAGIGDRALATRLGSLRNGLTSIESSANSAVFQHARANGAPITKWAGRAAQNLGHMSVGNAAMKGGFAVFAPAMATKTVLHAKDHLHNLKEIYGEITGKDPSQVSTFELLFSKNVPEVVGQARHGLIAKFGPELLADAGSLAVNAHFLLNKGGAMFMMGGFMAQMMSGNLTPDNILLDTYGQIKEMEKQGAEVPDEMLTKLIGAASKKAANHGGAANLMVQRMAAQYKAEGLGAAAILKEITQGKPFDERAMGIQKEIAAEREAAKAEAKKASKSTDNPTGKILSSHAAAVGTKPAAVNDNGKPSLKVGAGAEHQGRVAEVQREVSGS